MSLLPGLPGPFRVRGVTHGQSIPRARRDSAPRSTCPGRPPRTCGGGLRWCARASPRRRARWTWSSPCFPPPRRRSRAAGRSCSTSARRRSRRGSPCSTRPSSRRERRAGAQRLQGPVAALPGQRFILSRGATAARAGATLAGGRVLTIGAPRRRRGAAELLAPMRGEDLDARLVWLARQSGYRGLTSASFAVRTASAAKTVQRALEVLSSKDRCCWWTGSGGSTRRGDLHRPAVARWRCSRRSMIGRRWKTRCTARARPTWTRGCWGGWCRRWWSVARWKVSARGCG